MAIDRAQWDQLRAHAGKVFGSSLHFAIATTNGDGTPHVTPIGSLIFGEPGEAFFFEVFARQLSKNLDRGSAVAVLGVISSSSLWARSLIAGHFSSPPAFRLLGAAGERRPSTAEERARWRRKLRFLKWTRGHDRLFGNLDFVRELHLHEVKPVRFGQMTSRFE